MSAHKHVRCLVLMLIVTLPTLACASTTPGQVKRLTPPPPTATAARGTIQAAVKEKTGYIHLAADKAAFVYDGGARFVPNGWNAHSAWERTTFEERYRLGSLTYDEWFAALEASGVNSVRIWLSGGDQGHGPGIEPPPIGTYNIADRVIDRYGPHYLSDQVNGTEPDFGSRLADSNITQLVRAAERHHVRLMITLFEHDELRSQWQYSAYNAHNVRIDGTPTGSPGPLNDPSEFWTNPEAREYAQRRIQFILDAWGDSPAIWAWEIMNEADLAVQTEKEAADMVAWVKDMARYLKQHDIHQRPVTVSSVDLVGQALPQTGDEVDSREQLAYLVNQVFEGSEIDIVILHDYRLFTLNKRLAMIRLLQQRYNKPVLIGEFWPWSSQREPLPSTVQGPLIYDSFRSDPPYEDPPFYHSLGYIWLTLISSGSSAMRWNGFGGQYPEWGYLEERVIYEPAARFIESMEHFSWAASTPWELRVISTPAVQFKVAQGDGDQVLLMLVGGDETDVLVIGLEEGVYQADLFDWTTGRIARSVKDLPAYAGTVSFHLTLSQFAEEVGIVHLYRQESTGGQQ
jgi:hypothetical protein